VVVGELDALYHRGTREPPCVIAAPHPALGGSMRSPVVAELAWALTRAGHPTMRFDYRAWCIARNFADVAGSGHLADLREEVADLQRVCEHLLASTQMTEVCAVGYSFERPWRSSGRGIAGGAVGPGRPADAALRFRSDLGAAKAAAHRLRAPGLILRPARAAAPRRSPAGDHPPLGPFLRRGLTELGKTSPHGCAVIDPTTLLHRMRRKEEGLPPSWSWIRETASRSSSTRIRNDPRAFSEITRPPSRWPGVKAMLRTMWGGTLGARPALRERAIVAAVAIAVLLLLGLGRCSRTPAPVMELSDDAVPGLIEVELRERAAVPGKVVDQAEQEDDLYGDALSPEYDVELEVGRAPRRRCSPSFALVPT